MYKRQGYSNGNGGKIFNDKSKNSFWERRIENPLAAVTEERAAYLQQEKEFYTALASKIRE